ncbi:hypothetical protein B9G55_13205 [Saccharibacillus sp. O16]|nr:hypothetical protein B9G55_13205 [Saccharibacillus sp. O16]
MYILTLGTKEKTQKGGDNNLYRDWTISGTGRFPDSKKNFFSNNKKVEDLLNKQDKPIFAIGHVQDHPDAAVSLLSITKYRLDDSTGTFTFDYEFIKKIPGITTEDIKTKQLVAYTEVDGLENRVDLKIKRKEKLKLFIGSSSESKDDVRFLLAHLNEHFESEIELYPWYGVFRPGDHVGNRILELADQMDKAIFIFNDDDVTSNPQRGEKVKARDNVIFEYGVMVSKKGMKNVVVFRKDNVIKPTDLDGMVDIMYSDKLEKSFKAHRIIEQHIKESWL